MWKNQSPKFKQNLITVSPEAIDEAIEWMRVVRKSWEVKELPTKNYRSNSKVCKNCPIRKACDEAGAGVVKIASLEELSETL